MMHPFICSVLVSLSIITTPSLAAEIAKLSHANWDDYAPTGKEVDAIYGDFVIRNDKIVSVMANPIEGRHGNVSTPDVGGAVIDLTTVDQPNDQLTAFYPDWGNYPLKFKRVRTDTSTNEDADTASAHGRWVEIQCESKAAEDGLSVLVTYRLTDGEPFLLVTSQFTNNHHESVEIALGDRIRADRTFEVGTTPTVTWRYDKWFGQAYGIVVEDLDFEPQEDTIKRGSRMYYLHEGQSKMTLAPGERYTLVRRLFPAKNLIEVRSIANELAGITNRELSVYVVDAAGPVTNANVILSQQGEPYAWGRTTDTGTLFCNIPEGEYEVTAVSDPRGRKTIVVDTQSSISLELPQPGYVKAHITDEGDNPIPCKVQFRGVGDTMDPDFGPNSGEHAVKNLYYTEKGSFHHEMAPGNYQVFISRGPEYDAVFQTLSIERGQTTQLTATLVRTVDTPGWISTEFHSHSSPSGDNTTSQFGRVLNLLCEHLEFAPCTEHNRISSYLPHLKRLGATKWMATCAGMELSGQPLPLNHQNAFPLIHKPHTQDGGGPTTHEDPTLQIERLALWDNASDKLIQQNHPNITQLLEDRDLDGKPDEGFQKMFGFMDVIEVHPPIEIIQESSDQQTILHWLRLLNLGYRIPGVVNTDAHFNFHGSGWLRNYVKSPTDDPSQIKPLDVVHATEHGQLIMTNGPYMEVKLLADTASADVGDQIELPEGKCLLHVRVQCPNWFDVDRVQLFFNGRPQETLNFRRAQFPRLFSAKTVRFEHRIPIALDGDTHLIVAAVGENSRLGPIMGPKHENDLPVAVSNPIFVDVDGDGFAPNGDQLDFVLGAE